ncbi:MAG: hypothetical protein HDQ88_02110, partial [Clostridia bacterium]|nr:hypothetical protein [Clostridia bacterium]
MNYQRTLPKTKTVKVDLLGRDGDIPVSCFVNDGELTPALSAVRKQTAFLQNTI